MKTILKKLALVLFALVFVVSCFTACEGVPGGNEGGNENEGGNGNEGGNTVTVVYSLVLSASKTELSRGDVVTLSAVLKAEGKEDMAAEDVEYSIVSGSEYATLANNTLTVLSTAPHGAEIKVKATEGATASNEVILKVSVPAGSITVSAGGATNILAGQSLVLSAVVAPEGADPNVVWTITEGSSYATLAGNVLVVNSNAVTGATVKVQASVGEEKSEELSFTVGYPLSGITISAIGSLNIVAGTSAQVNVLIDPQNATNANYNLVFANDCGDYASISGNVITVSSTAVTGDKISVKAVAGDIESNVITYTVGYPLEEIAASVVGSSNINPGNTAAISVSLTPSNTTNGNYTWEFVEGGEYANISGNVISVSTSAPIGTVIKFKAISGDIESEVISIVVGTPIESLTISSSAPAVLDRGASYSISLNATPDGASLNAVSWIVSEGAEFASVSNGMLLIASNTPAGTTVKLHAASGSIVSNDLTYTVGVALEEIEISLSGSANVDPDNSKVISATLTPSNASDTVITWVIEEGNEYASIVNGVITVNHDAPVGAQVKFHAEIGSVVSNTLTITVGTPITDIVISTTSSLNIVKGNNAVLNVSLTPSNASASLISWVITQDNDSYASIANNILTISESAPTGAKIKVKAVFGDVESNEIEFTVKGTAAEENLNRFFIELSSKNITVDKKGSSTPVVIGGITNANFDDVTDRNLVYTVTSGAELLSITQDGNNCSFTALGHGTATVTVTVPGSDATATITVKVIVPPDSIVLPEVFNQRTEIDYAFSMVDPDTKAPESLPFVPTVLGSAYACQDFGITFLHSSGAASDEIAVYENGAITFKKTGRVTAIVTSKSGSNVEASTSYTFDINEGYNVHTFAELNRLLDDSKYTGQAINLVVLEKPVAQYETSYNYGYDLVPPSALKDLSALRTSDTLAYVRELIQGSDGGNRIQAVNKSVWINGNNHKIDASQLPTFTTAEYNAYMAANPESQAFPNLSSLFSAEPWTQSGEDTEGLTKGKIHTVRFYNVEVVGNSPLNFGGEISASGGALGCYTIGISIGASVKYSTDYYVECNNLTASGFETGLRISDCLENSKITNINAYNCYASGIRVLAAQITLENITIGSCGACAIEISPDRCNAAGVKDNEKTKVTFAGTIDAETNKSKGDSIYFQHYKVMGYTVPQVIGYNVQNMTPYQQSHIFTSDMEFNFVSLLMNDISTGSANTSLVDYPAYQEGGIIDIKDLQGSIDTTHQYIIMDVHAPNLGVVGRAIFYNMNYQGE